MVCITVCTMKKGFQPTPTKRQLWTMDPPKDVRRVAGRLAKKTGKDRTRLICIGLIALGKEHGCIGKRDQHLLNQFAQ